MYGRIIADRMYSTITNSEITTVTDSRVQGKVRYGRYNTDIFFIFYLLGHLTNAHIELSELLYSILDTYVQYRIDTFFLNFHFFQSLIPYVHRSTQCEVVGRKISTHTFIFLNLNSVVTVGSIIILYSYYLYSCI